MESIEPPIISRTITSTGVRISPLINDDNNKSIVKSNNGFSDSLIGYEKGADSEKLGEGLGIKAEPIDLGFDNNKCITKSNSGFSDSLIGCEKGADSEKLDEGLGIKAEPIDLGFDNNKCITKSNSGFSDCLISYEKGADSEKLDEGLGIKPEPIDLGFGDNTNNYNCVVFIPSDSDCKDLADIEKVDDDLEKLVLLEKDLNIKNECPDGDSRALVSYENIDDSEKLVSGLEKDLGIKEEPSELGFVNKGAFSISNDNGSMALVKCDKVNDSQKLVSESDKDVIIIKEEPLSSKIEDKGGVLVPKPISQMSPKEYVEYVLKPVSELKPKVETNIQNLAKRELENRTKGQNGPFTKKGKVEDKVVVNLVIEDGDFPEDPDWLLVGRTVITGLSTTKGRKLEDNEIVHFAFPSDSVRKSGPMFMSLKAAAANSAIVRFSTKRSGEIGRLPMEWAKCLIPLVNSSKVKVLGRCVAAPASLYLMQEIMLYISFYIHHSIFSEVETTTWKLDANPNIDSTIYPLLTLFKLLKTRPFQKAEFTPEELDSRKRALNLEADLASLPALKKVRGVLPEHAKDEQAVSESSLNKLVGAVDVYNLEEMTPPDTLTCDLRPYQKQALFWMTQLEKGVDVEKAAETLHPCWAAYRITDDRASAIYVNIFSGEATTKFPTAMQMTRGGILADAMGLGKTVMTIALILSNSGRGSCNHTNVDTEYVKRRKQDMEIVPYKVKGNTLIICPMALLSQWRDELETHSTPGTISTFVHYGGDRTNDPNVIGKHDVVLTTYGVLTAAFKSEGENSIFHRIEWFRIVLDEAHIIKSSRTQGAQAAFSLTSHCRWCLTGTPLQNNLEDLYSLLCFLHVEPWCNWAWWSKLIQKPYENGDQRGMKLIKSILRPLMLRRTKETKDKEGRPILVLPPTNIQVIECEQSEAEYDFYEALFKRSKVQFDQFVAQGKVLHNYANILELLLRLRQCCNHPFLVMSRGDSQEYADLNKLARKFLESNPESATSTPKVPSKAYVEEVIDNIRGGENTECPICLESADDPIFTPCAHRMCRECLLSSWRTPAAGLCPICRQYIKKTELITCPSDNRFTIDVEKNWKESSKVSKLFECLENIRVSMTGEKSIVFSQWTSFFDLLEIPLKKKGIGYLRFDGRLTQKQRERVLNEFNETTEKTVLLMSLKAGGVGLNLTAASYVFLMDPWWNPAVEEQAIMRIHRIGQKRTVSVRRFIVKDTVEERMQQVQARKQRMIAGALTDEEVRSARLEELKMLFR